MENHRKIAETEDTQMIALVGNPNVGKSVVFGLLTGKYVVVSNYPGTTVEVSVGSARLGGEEMRVVDTPGANSLIPNSEDERVARNLLLELSGRVKVVQVADAKNLWRALVLTSQLAEAELPTMLDLNMWDEAVGRGIEIDIAALSERLGIPVVCTVATERRGVSELEWAIGQAAVPRWRPHFGEAIERGIGEVESLLPELGIGRRAAALMLLASDPDIERILRERGGEEAIERVRAVRERLQAQYAEPLRYVLSRIRVQQARELSQEVQRGGGASVPRAQIARSLFFFGFAPLGAYLMGANCVRLVLALLGHFVGLPPIAAELVKILAGVCFTWHVLAYLRREERSACSSVTAHLGRLTLMPSVAIPVLVNILWAMYKLVGEFGAGTCVNFLENVIFGTAALDASGAPQPSGGFRLFSLHVPFDGINYYLGVLARKVLSPDGLLFQFLLGEEVGLIQVGLTYAIAIVLPIVSFFFLGFGLLEDSGLLPRMAVMLDHVLKRAGLSGKAVLPIVLGLGCDSMATLATRILETRKERLIATLLLALAVPCSAQLGVIAGALGGISGMAFFLYVVVITSQLFLVGHVASRVLPGPRADFVIEIPPFRMPQLRNVVAKTWYRMVWFLKEAVPVFLLGTFILFVATKLHILMALERLGKPVVQHLLGLPLQTTRGFILGFLRRDYGAVDILRHTDRTDVAQVLVALVVITLFVPCIAQFFIMIKEQGIKRAFAIVGFVVPYAILVGAVLRLVLRAVPARFLSS